MLDDQLVDSASKELPNKPQDETLCQQLTQATSVKVSQGGLISKIEVEIIVAPNVPDNGIGFDKIDKIHSQI